MDACPVATHRRTASPGGSRPRQVACCRVTRSRALAHTRACCTACGRRRCQVVTRTRRVLATRHHSGHVLEQCSARVCRACRSRADQAPSMDLLCLRLELVVVTSRQSGHQNLQVWCLRQVSCGVLSTCIAWTRQRAVCWSLRRRTRRSPSFASPSQRGDRKRGLGQYSLSARH
jgi:hypothetical protein